MRKRRVRDLLTLTHGQGVDVCQMRKRHVRNLLTLVAPGHVQGQASASAGDFYFSNPLLSTQKHFAHISGPSERVKKTSSPVGWPNAETWAP